MVLLKKTLLFLVFMILSCVVAQELDDDLTLNKKPIIILPARDADNPGSISNKLTAIVAQKATEMGRFEVIDRRLVDAILEEQKLQVSGMISESQIVKIGELAAAEEAFMVNVIEFGQKGVPKIIKPQQREKDEKEQNQDETLSTWVVKTMVGATAKAIVESAKSDAVRRVELENNIHTVINAEVRMLNVATGVSTNSFRINAQFTGGNRDASLNMALTNITWQISRKLRGFYALTSEVMQVDGYELTMLTGDDLGIKQGSLFEIASIDREKTYKDRTVTIPGKARALARITNVGPDASEAKVIRKWRKVVPGLKAYEMMKTPLVSQIDLFYGQHPWYELSAKFWLMPFRKLSVGLGGQLGLLEDSEKNNNAYLGIGSTMDLDLFYIFGITPSMGISIPVNLFMRRDDRNHDVFSTLITPSVDLNLAIQLGQFRDLVISTRYIFSHIHSDWTYQAETDNENGGSFSNKAVWDGIEPTFSAIKGFYFNLSLRKIRF